METIKVNMSPNPLDVQTIHASQNDGEARQWEFELHNNGELIDTSNVTEQMFFKAYKGGTEQLLPENGSTPTTSPIIADIKYPQGLLTDQEFLYRESPTEEDGLAKITDIKGNTLVWNQLIEKGNMTDGWTFSNSTGSYSNNILTFTVTAKNGFVRPDRPQYIYAGHKYFATVDVKATSAFTGRIYFTGHNESFILDPNYTTSWKTFSLVFTNTVTEYNYYPRVFDTRDSDWDAVQIRNCMLIDLTQMGLDITDPSDFTSLFSLPYYAYNQGSLLSFNGNGIKTVGKNLFNGNESYSRDSAGYYIREGNTNNPIPLKLAKGTYTISIKSTVAGTSQLELFSGGITSADRFLAPYITLVVGVKTYTFTIEKQSDYIRLYGSFVGTISDIQIEYGSTATDYEPYTSSTLSLPISTYFPNGMKSAGNVYDELTESKAITRIGAVDLGTQSWRAYTDVTTRKIYYATISGMDSTSAQIACDGLTAVPWGALPSMAEKTIQAHPSLSIVYACDSSCEDATEFTSAMSGVYLFYELATPTETSFTTASLVTENAEIPLSNNDGTLIGKCTEQLSENPGFIDAKIKLSDADGECYSNKLQLHVERSPQ